MAKLDDFLAKKKETAPILDLSKTVANSEKEFRRLLEKVPDFKIKPEKIQPETIKIKDKNFTFKIKTKQKKEKYSFMDPLPVELKNLKLEDLTSVPIDWKMLTSLRPKSKAEENFFSRMVELGKLQNKSRIQEKRQYQLEPQIRKTKNRSGVIEMRVLSCTECGEDFCTGKTCCKCGYDSFARLPDVPKTEKATSPSLGAIPKRKIRRSRSKSKRRTDKDKSKGSSKKRSKSRKNL